MVQERIDARGQVVEHATGVHQIQVHLEVGGLRLLGRVSQVDGEQALRVERRPAHEERRHYCN